MALYHPESCLDWWTREATVCLFARAPNGPACAMHTAKCITAAFLQFFESRYTAKALELYYDVKLLLFSIILRKKAKEIPYMVPWKRIYHLRIIVPTALNGLSNLYKLKRTIIKVSAVFIHSTISLLNNCNNGAQQQCWKCVLLTYFPPAREDTAIFFYQPRFGFNDLPSFLPAFSLWSVKSCNSFFPPRYPTLFLPSAAHYYLLLWTSSA